MSTLSAPAEIKADCPYKGMELVRAFSDPAAGRHSLQIEVNRRLYMDERTRQKGAGFEKLCAHLDQLVEVLDERAEPSEQHFPERNPGGA